MFTLIWLVWLGLVIAASYYVGKAYGGPLGLLALVGLFVLGSILPFGTLLTGAAAIAIGYQADVAADHKQLEQRG